MTAAAGPKAVGARTMVACTAKVAETHLVTCVPLPGDYVKALKETYDIDVHYIKPVQGKNPLQFRRFEASVRNVIKEVNPDIVHVHGAWDFMAAMAEWKSRHENVTTVVSPHRGLSQAIINIDFWNKKLIRLLTYQLWMVRGCTAIIAVNEKEKEDVMSLGMKKRIEVMPEMPKDIDKAGQMRDALMAAYRKALDSTYFRHLKDEERNFVDSLTKAAVVDADTEVAAPDTKGISFRNVFFYAYDEDVTELMLQGAQKLHVAMPPTLSVEKQPRYVNRKAKKRGSINDAASKKSISLNQSQGMEYVAVSQIAKAHSVTLNRLTLRRYAELYKLFRYTDFNEDVVGKELKRIGLKGFTKELQKTLAVRYGLQPGFNIF